MSLRRGLGSIVLLTVARRVSTWALHRSSIIFGPDANVFRPERWLDAPEVELQKMERNNELIFGHGRFGCLGKTIAFMELNKIFVEVRWLSLYVRARVW